MGIFSSKKTTVVSSTVYNMAGDEADRPNFLKNSIFGAVMSPYNPYLGETLVRNYLNGPGLNQRKFFNWAVRQDYPGLPTYTVTQRQQIEFSVVSPFITTPSTPAGLVIALQSAYVVSGEYEHFVEQFILENYPQNYNTDYVASFDTVNNLIVIQWEGGGTVDFSASVFDKEATYVVANYYHYLPSEIQDLITGSTTVGVLTKPSTTGYSLDSSSNSGVVSYDMNYDERIIVTYVGPGAPPDTDDTTSESDSVNFDGLDEVWSKITYEGGDGDTEETINREHFLNISEYRQIYTNNTQVSLVVNEDTPSAGITQTIETRRINDHLRPIWDWRIDTQDTINLKIIDDGHIFVYEIGTGETTLDDLIEDLDTNDEQTAYFPYLPIRLDNDSINHHHYDDDTGSGLYTKTSRAYRRATGGWHQFYKLVDEIEDNESIDDIDFSFIHFGVNLNVIEPACKKYMYTWFKDASALQNTDSNYMTVYQALVATYLADIDTMDDWIFAQEDSSRNGYGDPPPSKPSLADLKSTTIKLRCADNQLKNLDMRISWVNISETTHSGVGKDGAVKGDIWWDGYPSETPDESDDFSWTMLLGLFGSGIKTKSFKVEKLELYWQTGSNNYKKLSIWGLVHNNYVYNGETVETTGRAALGSTDATGFIIPLNYTSVKNLGLVDSTQMATANTFVIFNSYEIVKQRWYESFIVMLIIFLVIVVIVVLIPPLGGAAAGGVLGTNAAVGAAIGFTGTAAIVAGAITNALVAIAISQIITAGAKAIFGDKIGAIVGAVVTMLVTAGISGTFDVGNLSELVTVENVMKIASAVANGYSGYVQGAVAEIGDELEQNAEEQNDEMKKISDMLSKLRGNNDLNFDPLRLTDSVLGNDLSSDGVGYITETLDEFIHRTTMTGSDIVEISLSLVNDYADLSLRLPS